MNHGTVARTQIGLSSSFKGITALFRFELA